MNLAQSRTGFWNWHSNTMLRNVMKKENMESLCGNGKSNIKRKRGERVGFTQFPSCIRSSPSSNLQVWE